MRGATLLPPLREGGFFWCFPVENEEDQSLFSLVFEPSIFVLILLCFIILVGLAASAVLRTWSLYPTSSSLLESSSSSTNTSWGLDVPLELEPEPVQQPAPAASVPLPDYRLRNAAVEAVLYDQIINGESFLAHRLPYQQQPGRGNMSNWSGKFSINRSMQNTTTATLIVSFSR